MGLEGLLQGRVLLGRYRVDGLLGRGAMGVVYRATDGRLEREVAIKVLREHATTAEARATARRRFRREATTAARIGHPSVVQIFDFGTDEELDIDLLVMELLKGEDLGAWARDRTPLHPDEARDLARQAALGLGAGHAAGLVHRDVKPSNLFVSPTAVGLRVRVLDFGIVEMAEGADTLTRLTAVGVTPHTAGYASPEQLAGSERLTPASDVYSLGVTLFELLTGERAFGSDPDDRRGAGSRFRRALEEHSVPEDLIGVVACATDPDPTRRFAGGDAMAAALRGVAVAAWHDAGTPRDAVVGDDATAVRATQPAAPSRLAERMVAVAAVAIIVGVFAWVVPRDDEPAVPGYVTAVSDGLRAAGEEPSEESIATRMARLDSAYEASPDVPSLPSTREVRLDGYASGGGEALLYSPRGSLVKARVVLFEPSVRYVLDYLYARDQLVFVHRWAEIRDRPGGPLVRTDRDRLYFRDGRLVGHQLPDGARVELSGGADPDGDGAFHLRLASDLYLSPADADGVVRAGARVDDRPGTR